MEMKEAKEVLEKERDALNGYMQIQDMHMHRERFLRMILSIQFFLNLAENPEVKKIVEKNGK